MYLLDHLKHIIIFCRLAMFTSKLLDSQTKQSWIDLFQSRVGQHTSRQFQTPVLMVLFVRAKLPWKLVCSTRLVVQSNGTTTARAKTVITQLVQNLGRRTFFAPSPISLGFDHRRYHLGKPSVKLKVLAEPVVLLPAPLTHNRQ